MAKPDFTHLDECVEDARRSVVDADPGPADPTDYHDLRGRLVSSRAGLPPLYRNTFHDPYERTLDELGPSNFIQLLLSDPDRNGIAGLVLDAAHAILQNGEGYQKLATDSFQEVVSDLYDGFLSEEDRRGVKAPDHGVIPPLVKWGNPHFGPYTFTIRSASNLGIGAGIVSLPPANARLGLLAWGALGHETAGHDILHADDGLRVELANAVFDSLEGNPILARYWSDRIDETASDVMGIVNMGPAAGISLIGYFRGIRAARPGGSPKLGNVGFSQDLHPADILRGYLAAAAVRRCSFSDSLAWSKEIEKETDRDHTEIRIGATVMNVEGTPAVVGGMKLSKTDAKASADLVATTILDHPLETLEGHSIREIQDWKQDDEVIVDFVRLILRSSEPIPRSLASGIYAAHVVAAAICEALAGAEIPPTFSKMLMLLKVMHDTNPSWGPLHIAHPGDVSRHHLTGPVVPVGVVYPVGLSGPGIQPFGPVYPVGIRPNTKAKAKASTRPKKRSPAK